MNLADLAALTGKSIAEVKVMLKEEDIVEVKLSDKKERVSKKEEGAISIC